MMEKRWILLTQRRGDTERGIWFLIDKS